MTTKLEQEKADAIADAKRGIAIAEIFLQDCKKEDRPKWMKRKQLCEWIIKKIPDAKSEHEMRQLYTAFIICDPAQ